MVGAVERIKKRESLREQYVHDYEPKSDDERIGRAKGEIINITSYVAKYDTAKFSVHVETEWGEVIKWNYAHDRFHKSWISRLCEEMDIPFSQFDDVTGMTVWMNVEELDWQEGEAVSQMSIDRHDLVLEK